MVAGPLALVAFDSLPRVPASKLDAGQRRRNRGGAATPHAARLPLLARKAIEDPEVLQQLLANLRAENTDIRVRERAFKSLKALALARPNTLLPNWTTLAGLLRSEKPFVKYLAVHLIAALVPADRKRRFDRSFNAYFALLDDEAVSVAAHVAGLAGPIPRARPDLEPRITRRLLALDRIHFDPERRDLVKSYALEAFGETFDRSTRRASMLSFARALLTSRSPRAAKAAWAFLKAHAGEGV